MKRAVALCHAFACLLSTPVACGHAHAGELRVGIEGRIGAPLNVTTPLEIRQTGSPTLALDASFRTEPFDRPIYWSVRVAVERHGHVIGFEIMHHKLILENRPPEIQRFNVSHGFNFVTLQRAWPSGAYRLRLGLGAILAHPENEVRHRPIDESRGILGKGYYLAGPVALVAGERHTRILRWASLLIEARLSVAPVQLPIAAGEARFTHVAVHLLFGLALFPI